MADFFKTTNVAITVTVCKLNEKVNITQTGYHGNRLSTLPLGCFKF